MYIFNPCRGEQPFSPAAAACDSLFIMTYPPLVLNCSSLDLTPLRGRDLGPSTEFVFLRKQVILVNIYAMKIWMEGCYGQKSVLLECRIKWNVTPCGHFETKSNHYQGSIWYALISLLPRLLPKFSEIRLVQKDVTQNFYLWCAKYLLQCLELFVTQKKSEIL